MTSNTTHKSSETKKYKVQEACYVSHYTLAPSPSTREGIARVLYVDKARSRHCGSCTDVQTRNIGTGPNSPEDIPFIPEMLIRSFRRKFEEAHVGTGNRCSQDCAAF